MDGPMDLRLYINSFLIAGLIGLLVLSRCAHAEEYLNGELQGGGGTFTGGAVTSEILVDELGLEFQETDTLTDCSTFSTTGGGIFYDDSEGVLKKCQDNVLTDLDTGSGGGSALEVEDESVSLDTAVTKVNFLGSGVTAVENADHEIDVTVAGGAAPVDSVNTQTGAVVLDADDIDDTSTTHKFISAAERAAWNAKLGTDPDIGTATGTALALSGDATVDQVVSMATANPPFIVNSSSQVADLNCDLLDGQHGSYYQDAVATVTQVEAEAGTGTTVRLYTPERVAQAIAALAPSASVDQSADYSWTGTHSFSITPTSSVDSPYGASWETSYAFALERNVYYIVEQKYQQGDDAIFGLLEAASGNFNVAADGAVSAKSFTSQAVPDPEFEQLDSDGLGADQFSGAFSSNLTNTADGAEDSEVKIKARKDGSRIDAIVVNGDEESTHIQGRLHARRQHVEVTGNASITGKDNKSTGFEFTSTGIITLDDVATVGPGAIISGRILGGSVTGTIRPDAADIIVFESTPLTAGTGIVSSTQYGVVVLESSLNADGLGNAGWVEFGNRDFASE